MDARFRQWNNVRVPILVFATLGNLIRSRRHVRNLLELVVDRRLVLDDVRQLGHRQRVRLQPGILEGRVSVRSLRHPHRVALAAPYAVVHGHVVQTVRVEANRAAPLPVRDLRLALAEYQL